ncbi:hypothetical protein ACT80S_02050 [Ramlibacter sp. MAHUQ-53]|uniref:hypothetical protein n=1 Tax=unclassified Ramlibacter TaxID=2617605 RepID=UPI003628DFD6
MKPAAGPTRPSPAVHRPASRLDTPPHPGAGEQDPPQRDAKHAGGYAALRPCEAAGGLPVRQRQARHGTDGASSSTTTTSSPAIPAPVLQEVARALAEQEARKQCGRILITCDAELHRLCPTLKRPLDTRLVEGLATRVVDALARSPGINIGALAGTLVKLLDGPALGVPALRTMASTLMAARERLPAETFLSAMLAMVRELGGPGLSAAHRDALLDTLVEHLAGKGLPEQPLADACVAALTDPAAWPDGPPVPLAVIAARALAAGAAGPSTARAALLQAMSRALARTQDHAQRGAAYLALVRQVPEIDPAMHVHVGAEFHLHEMAQGADGAARIEAFFRGLAQWAVTTDAGAAFHLMTGACDGLWHDTGFSPALWRAALRGVLSAGGPGHEWLFSRAVSGLVGQAVHLRRLEPAHIGALMGLLEPMPLQQAGDTRASTVLTVLCTCLSQASWPAAVTEALVDEVLTRAPRWPTARCIEAGRHLGECLDELDREAPLFSQVVDRIADLAPLSHAARLLGGFVLGLSLDPGEEDALAAFQRALTRPALRGTGRAIALGASIAAALRAWHDARQGPGSWSAHLRALPGGLGGAISPLGQGLALLASPVPAVRATKLPPADQMELLEFAWGDLVQPGSDALHRQVDLLDTADFGGDDALRVDMLLALFQHAGRAIGAKTFLLARDIVIGAIARAPADPAPSPAPAEGKGPPVPRAAQALSPRESLWSQLDALYRYYLTASGPPSYLLSPQVPEMARRLAWAEDLHRRAPPDVVTPAERELLRQVAADYAPLLAGATPAPPPPPSGGDGKSAASS